MGSEQGERPDRVRPAPHKALPVLLGKRLREDEQSVARAREGERRGAPERNADTERPQDASDGRARDEADAPGGSDHPERPGAPLDRCHVGHVGRRGRKAGGHDPGQDAPDEEPRQALRQRHDDVVEPESEPGQDQDGAAAEAIREHADERREEELHQPPDRHQEPVDRGGLGLVPDEVRDQMREDGDRDPEGEGVQDDRHVDEGHRGLAVRPPLDPAPDFQGPADKERGL